jgi:hypothetical protein
MKHPNGGALKLADLIDNILGSGPMDISFDKVRRALDDAYGMGLDPAASFIERHLSTALDILGERGWSAVKTTAYWNHVGHVDPSTLNEPEIKKCIAGIGKGGIAVGLHFTLIADDWLWVYARDHRARVWRGTRKIEIERLRVEADAGRLTASGLAIAERSAVDPEIGDKVVKQAHRAIAAQVKP